MLPKQLMALFKAFEVLLILCDMGEDLFSLSYILPASATFHTISFNACCIKLSQHSSCPSHPPTVGS